MTLYETIGMHLKEAMKSGDVLRRDTLRLLQSALKNVAIEKRVTPDTFSDSEVEEVLKRLVKQRRDSIAQYRAGNREDLALQEESELNLLSAYLPEAMGAEDLRVLVTTLLKEANITAKSQMGQAMGIAVKGVAGRASGDDIRKIVESLLI
ncbi:MAG: GatB/YqeY domain-containing protein [Candidatus Moranbacteria bacterium]|nr:GatB/YqeY domain-containing protein [Candidatus Moranbacteria bacterium]MDD3964752.1 GatB/YqeY domain-containing protein [Candidatus Moranbacteria bacterium]